MWLYETFKQEKRPALQQQLGKKNIFQTPVLDKVIVAIGVGSLATRKGVKDFSDIEKNIVTITWQKPQMILSKQSISNFKLRDGMPSMLRVTLRWRRAYDFIERLVKLALPRVRDFSGLSPRKFDWRGNYSLWLPNMVVFPEITPEEITTAIGVQISLITTTENDNEAKALLESLWIIFQKKQS